MKKFVSIKDVKLNDMKKKELIEANGGFFGLFKKRPIIDIGVPYGKVPPAK